MRRAQTRLQAGLVLSVGLLVACSAGPTQPPGGERQKSPFQTQQLDQIPSFGTVTPDEYRAARESACSRYCTSLYPGESRAWSLLRWQRNRCMRRCLTGGPTDMFPNR